MLKQTLLFLSERNDFKNVLFKLPFASGMSGRFVAGDTSEEALDVARQLNDSGFRVTLDLLGESVSDRAEAERAAAEYAESLTEIDAHEAKTTISLKLTQLGLDIDTDFCYENLLGIVRRAEELGNFVRIDMEDHTCTDATLRMYRRVHEAHPKAVGVVLQAYMHRTTADINDLSPLRPNIRICKGIYREPRAIAWHDFSTVRENFIYNMEKLLALGSYVGIATHDSHLVWAGMSVIDRLGLDRDRYEFQMLLGVDPELRKIILAEGHRLRVYVPFGRDWYPYSMRRLRENPSVAGHVMRAMLPFSHPT